MSATLTKARAAGPQAAHEPSNAELPASIYPARVKLAGKLTEFERTSLDIEEARGHLARSETDEAKALADENLSDSESMDAVAFAQKSRGVYAARVANREATQARLLPELKTAVNAAHNEYSGLCMNERERRWQILSDRVTKAAHLVGNFSREMEGVLENSQLIIDIRALEINSGAITYCGTEQMPSMARTILDRYETIATKMKEQI